jgi:two-component system nitrogen regulation response regulator GlnG
MMAVRRVLICDDEPSICVVLAGALRQAGIASAVAHTLADAQQALARGEVDVLLLDIFLPDGNGLDALPHIRDSYRDVPVIVLTAHGTMRTALEAMKRHAFDYITKPFEVGHVQDLVRRARALAKALRTSDDGEPATPPRLADGEEIVGNSPLMQEVYKTVGRVAGSDVSVLLQGECGTGKELVARAIRANSHRANGPFVVLNCAAIPPALLESELFGHVRGAFTNAIADRKGRFEEAVGGTLFLDEIGELSPDLQSKLLRVLQERTYQPVGSNETRVADVRIIAATNRDLAQAVRAGEFREDLLYRLNVVSITLPPLRKRAEDIPALAAHFLRKYGDKYGRERLSISPGLMARLETYSWPGNVRELENVVHRAVVLAPGPVLGPEDAPLLAVEPLTGAHEAVELWLRRILQTHLSANRVGVLYEDVLQRIETPLLRLVLEHTAGNKSRAAELLGMNRNTLHAKMKRHGLLDSSGDIGLDEDQP